MMNRVELEGVIAHELSHVKNYDILVSTVAVVTRSARSRCCRDIGLRFMFWGGRRRGPARQHRCRRDRGRSSPSRRLALLVLAPFAALLMQFSMSRKRELLADASGVQLTRYPPGLASALRKLQSDTAVVHHATRATAQLWIESPLERRRARRARDSTGRSTRTRRSRSASRSSRRCEAAGRSRSGGPGGGRCRSGGPGRGPR